MAEKKWRLEEGEAELRKMFENIKVQAQPHFDHTLVVDYTPQKITDGGCPYDGGYPFYRLTEVRKVTVRYFFGLIPIKRTKKRPLFCVDTGFGGMGVGKKEVRCGLLNGGECIRDIVMAALKKYAEAFEATLDFKEEPA